MSRELDRARWREYRMGARVDAATNDSDRKVLARATNVLNANVWELEALDNLANARMAGPNRRELLRLYIDGVQP